MVLAYVHLYTLFMVTPIFNTMMRIDRRLIEAAIDGGARPWQVHRATSSLPLCKPGIAIGSIFVVTLVMGDFITVRLMSGGQSASVGLMIANQISPAAIPGGLRQRRGTAGDGAADDRSNPAHRRHPEGYTATILPLPSREGGGGGGHASRLSHPRPRSHPAFFCLFVLFLYGPTLTILVLSFQGPDGGLTFPMNGVSLHWFARLFEPQAVGDFGGSLRRSLLLAMMVMVVTVVISLAAGLAFRRRFIGAGALFTLTIASLIIPSILVSLGIGLLFNADRPRSGLVQLSPRRAADLDTAVRRC